MREGRLRVALQCFVLAPGLAQSSPEPAPQRQADYQVATVARGFDRAFAMALLPDGDILVTEKPGRVRVVRGGRLVDAPLAGVPAVLFEGDYDGMQDVILHPRFSQNGLVYLSFVHGHKDANAVRVVRARYDGAALSQVEVVFTASPLKATINHPGARLAFMKDETLLITVGDGYEYREQAQSLDSMLGKIVRVTDTGRIPPDNPFVGAGGERSPVWSYGHRHPQGLLYDAVTDRLYEHEHGPQGGDELNVITKGGNYGWPIATYGISYSGTYVSPYQRYPGTEQPITYWTPSLAPCGIAQCRGCLWPEWEGDLFIGMLAGEQIQRVSLSSASVPRRHAMLAEIKARIRDVRFGPDGALYVLQDEGVLLRLTPKR